MEATINNNAYEALDAIQGLTLRIADINSTFHKATHAILWHEVGGLRVAKWSNQVDVKAKLALTVASRYNELDKSNSTTTCSQSIVELPDGLKMVMKITYSKDKRYPLHKMANVTVMLGIVKDIDNYLGIISETRSVYKDIAIMKSTSSAQKMLDKASEKRVLLSIENKTLRDSR